MWEVEDPTRFGIVGLDEESRITRFKEKPTPEEVFSNLINAGSYIFEDDIFDNMPIGKHSIERDVFPELASRKELNGQEFKGYFIDAGTPSAWSDAVNRCIIENRFNTGLVKGGTWYGSDQNPTSKHITQSMIQIDVDVQNSKIHRSTLLSGTSVGNDSTIESCLVGRDVKIGSNVNLIDVVVDHGSQVPDGTSLSNGQWPL